MAMATRSSSNKILKLWDQLNDALSYAPKFQNKDRPGVDEETIQQIESKLGVTLPKEIRDVVKVHDGRDRIRGGFTYRFATTDLIPIAKWRPYPEEDDDYPELLFECLTDESDECADKNLCNDLKQHLAAYIDGIQKAEQQSQNQEKNEYKVKNDETFQSLPCELLVIGEGMEDYVEQYLLSIQSGRIYLVVHNIPEWKLIGTFADWINMGIERAVNDAKNIQEEHDRI